MPRAARAWLSHPGVAVLAAVGIAEVWQGNKRVLEGTGIRVASLCLIQWLMILPHELGHALMARFFGYRQIRILIGSGKPLVSMSFLGFQWLLNLVPFSGLTVFHPGAKPERRKLLAVAAAGSLVNFLAAGLALPAALADPSYYALGTWPRLLFWANVLVLVESRGVQLAKSNEC